MSATIVDVFGSKNQNGLATFIASYPLRGNTNDVGNYLLTPWTNTGGVGFTTIDGYQCAGPYLGVGIIWDQSQSLHSILSFKPVWSVEMYVYLNSLSTDQCWFGYTNNGLDENTFAILTDGSVGIFHGPPPPTGEYVKTSPGAVTTGVWTKIAYSVTADTIGHIFVNDIELVSGIANIYTGLFDVYNFSVGSQILFGLGIDGYARNVKIKCPLVPALP
jgi:hypothetical protein